MTAINRHRSTFALALKRQGYQCRNCRTFSATIVLRAQDSESLTLNHRHVEGIIPYQHAARMQDKIVQQFLAHKANGSGQGTASTSPDPVIITTQFEPVYTCGRREVGTITQEQQEFLMEETPWGKAQFHEALRGGQTTFHGPGQLVAYPIIDLRRYGIRPKCYVNMLEAAVIATLKVYGVKGFRTDNPGVWVSEDDKICALGIHLRRNITSHGIGLNVSTELGWFGRIVACGLEGKGTTNLQQEHNHKSRPFGSNIAVADVAKVFVQQFAEALKAESKITLSPVNIRSTDSDVQKI